jgi:O-antigen ligase
VAIWGAGQLVPLEWWYLHGITAGDVVFILYVALAVTLSKGFRDSLISVTRDNGFYVISILGMICALLLSVWLNADKYVVSPYYVMSILRSGYFLLISLVVVIWATMGNLSALCKSYLFGLVIAWIWQFTISSISPDDVSQVKCSFFVMHNPNVYGNMLGVGIIFSTVLIMERQLLLAYLLSPVLAYFSLYCFSKGAWGMVVAGMLALIFASLYVVKTTIDQRVRRRMVMQFAVFVTLLATVVIAGSQKISCLLVTKEIVQAANGSLELRKAFLEDAIHSGKGNSLGVGVGRIADLPMHSSSAEGKSGDLQKLSRGDDSFGSVGHSSRGNPHSAFLYLLVSGGIASLVLFVLAAGFPFYRLWRIFPRSSYLNLYLLFSLIAFIISGSFQLQLFAQHFFWVFAGLLIALTDKYQCRAFQSAKE